MKETNFNKLLNENFNVSRVHSSDLSNSYYNGIFSCFNFGLKKAVNSDQVRKIDLTNNIEEYVLNHFSDLKTNSKIDILKKNIVKLEGKFKKNGDTKCSEIFQRILTKLDEKTGANKAPISTKPGYGAWKFDPKKCPPSKTPTPPPSTSSSPPKSNTPPPKASTPPPKSTTPPPKQPTPLTLDDMQPNSPLMPIVEKLVEAKGKKDPWILFGSPEEKSVEILKKAFRRLALIIHPNKNLTEQLSATSIFAHVQAIKDRLLLQLEKKSKSF